VLGLVALNSSFVLAADMDLVVDMDRQLLGVRLIANYLGQHIETQGMHSNCMGPKPSLKLEQNFAC